MLLYLRIDFDSLFLFEPDTKVLTNTGMINPKPFTSLIRIRRCDLLVTFLMKIHSVYITNQNFNSSMIQEHKLGNDTISIDLRIKQNGT